MSQAFGTGVGSARAFEIDAFQIDGKPDSRQWMRCRRSRHGFPESRFSRIPVSQSYGFPDKISRSLPSRPDPVRIVSLEYGSLPGHTQARQMPPDAPGDTADSCPGNPAKVKQFWRI
jgi:hypothetical protein